MPKEKYYAPEIEIMFFDSEDVNQASSTDTRMPWQSVPSSGASSTVFSLY